MLKRKHAFLIFTWADITFQKCIWSLCGQTDKHSWVLRVLCVRCIVCSTYRFQPYCISAPGGRAL